MQKKGVWIIIALVLVVAIIAFFMFNRSSTPTPITPSTPSGGTPNSILPGDQVNTSKQTPQTNTNTNTQTPQSRTADISGFAFSPATLTISVGDSVTWTNKDSATHTVTSDSGSELNSQSLGRGQTYEHTFNTAGTYKYHCTFHPGMKGTIIVQ